MSSRKLLCPENIGRILILSAGSLWILFSFHNILPFPNEVFYMSLPLVWGLFHFLFRRDVLKNLFRWRHAFKAAGYFVCVVAFFWYFSYTMRWKIIWKEVFLASYFLLAVGIIIYYTRCIIKAFAAWLVSPFRNPQKRKIISGLIYVCLWFLIILPYILAAFSIHRPKIGDQVDPRSELNLSYEQVWLRTRDGVRLHAWFVACPTSDRSVVIGHGLGANKSNFLPLVDLWHGLGYNVLIFDFRGHGHSEGHTVTFGAREKYDIIAAVHYLSARPDMAPDKIIGYGVSFGGAALIHAAKEDTRIKALVVDSSFSDVETMAKRVVDLVRFVPPFLTDTIARLGLMFVDLECGFPLRDYAPQQVIPHIHDRPVLIIHGKNDRLIPWGESKSLYDKARSPKEFYWVESAGHYATLVEPDYRHRLRQFLIKYKLQ